ncbi:MAG: WYL domain-containing protein [Ruminococcaceae bacterium]|nr:WYL domain-containing protein [Oscillospiraceae bacterium]
MSKSANQKLKLLYLLKILLAYTDEEHPLTVAELITHLAGYDITAERKSVYSDIELLREYGIDIETVKSKSFGYYVASRDFELPELKLLVDAVQSSKFITRKKSSELISKIEAFASRYQAKNLERQVFVANRIKTMNESIYYTVDYIHTAISRDAKISFKYFEWTAQKEKVLKHDGKDYVISPWALTWDDENYYLVAYDSDAHIIKHYRVDKITDIKILEEKREGAESFKEFDMAIYSKSVFGMFGGKAEYVSLLCHESLAGVIIDRFGQDVVFMKRDGGFFEINVSVVLSSQFYSWVFGFGDRMKILSPEKARSGFLDQIEKTRNCYM